MKLQPYQPRRSKRKPEATDEDLNLATEFSLSSSYPVNIEKELLNDANEDTLLNPSNQHVLLSSVKKFLPKKLIDSWQGHEKNVVILRWSHRAGKLLASASLDGSIKLWKKNITHEQEGMKLVGTIQHGAAVRDIQWNEQNNQLLSGGYSRHLIVTDIEYSRNILIFPWDHCISCLRWCPSEPFICLLGGYNSTILTYDTRTKSPIKSYRLKGFDGIVQDVEYMPDGNSFISVADATRKSSMHQTMVAWDIKTGAMMADQIYYEGYTCTSLRLHPSQKRFVAQSNGDYIAIFHIKDATHYPLDKYHRYEGGHYVQGHRIQCDYNFNGSLITTGSTNNSFCIYDVNSAKILLQQFLPLNSSSAFCHQAIFHPHHSSLLSVASSNGMIYLYQ